MRLGIASGALLVTGVGACAVALLMPMATLVFDWPYAQGEDVVIEFRHLVADGSGAVRVHESRILALLDHVGVLGGTLARSQALLFVCGLLLAAALVRMTLLELRQVRGPTGRCG